MPAGGFAGKAGSITKICSPARPHMTQGGAGLAAMERGTDMDSGFAAAYFCASGGLCRNEMAEQKGMLTVTE